MEAQVTHGAFTVYSHPFSPNRHLKYPFALCRTTVAVPEFLSPFPVAMSGMEPAGNAFRAATVSLSTIPRAVGLLSLSLSFTSLPFRIPTLSAPLINRRP